MMAVLRFLLLATLMGLCLADTRKRYDGYKVLRVTPTSMPQLQSVRSLQDTVQGEIEFWTEPGRLDSPVDILVGPVELNNVRNALQDLGLSFSTMIEDVQQRADSVTVGESGGIFSLAGFNYDIFHKYDEINQWVSSMAAQHSAIVQEDRLGYLSYEKRDMKLLKIGKPGPNKKIIWWQSGTHSREWLSPATVLKIASWLVRDYEAGQPEIVKLLDRVDFYIMPLFNPDGYVHSHEVDRMWRKTRTPTYNSNCQGVDPNRNFDAGWNTGGSSPDACTQTYHGPSAHSEIEVKALTEYILGLSNVEVFIDMHCYSQLWMFPYGYKTDYAANYNDQYYLAYDAMAALYAVNYKHFVVGAISHVLYPASGSSVDWAYEVAGIPYAYAPELRDDGHYGFIAPVTEIDPSAKEVYEAIKVIGNNFVN